MWQLPTVCWRISTQTAPPRRGLDREKRRGRRRRVRQIHDRQRATLTPATGNFLAVSEQPLGAAVTREREARKPPAQTTAGVAQSGVTIFVSPLPLSIPMTSIRAWTDSEGRAPLRCCLRDSQVGERLLLGAVAPPGPLGAYAETGPVFMHADHCPGPASSGYPEAFRACRQVFRAYDNTGQIVGGEIVEPGRNQEAVAERLLSTPRPKLRV
jgi:hypothetical protein